MADLWEPTIDETVFFRCDYQYLMVANENSFFPENVGSSHVTSERIKKTGSVEIPLI